MSITLTSKIQQVKNTICTVNNLTIFIFIAVHRCSVYMIYVIYHTQRGTAEQTRDIELLLVQCWADVVDGGPTFIQQ